MERSLRGEGRPPPRQYGCPPLLESSSVLSQALVYEHSGQHLEIELFDEDPDKDDFLGR